jgi:thiol:disulfide interchange protein DsbC
MSIPKNAFFPLCVIALAVASFPVSSEPTTFKDALEKNLPGLKVDSVNPSELDGLYEVTIGPKLFYVSDDARYMIQGSLIDLKEKKNLTEPKLAKARLDAIAAVGLDKMIVFKPDKPEHSVTVFTDIDCGYCRKLHSEIDQYMAAGIEIRYLFFPRAGKDSGSYDKAVSVWCAKDRNQALTDAKKGKEIDAKQCENPVLEHMALGEALGMRGTPLIVTDKGSMLPGYVPAKQLAHVLEGEAAADSD